MLRLMMMPTMMLILKRLLLTIVMKMEMILMTLKQLILMLLMAIMTMPIMMMLVLMTLLPVFLYQSTDLQNLYEISSEWFPNRYNCQVHLVFID